MYAREAFVSSCKVSHFLKKSGVSSCIIGKVAVPLHPQTRQGPLTWSGLGLAPSDVASSLHRSLTDWPREKQCKETRKRTVKKNGFSDFRAGRTPIWVCGHYDRQ